MKQTKRTSQKSVQKHRNIKTKKHKRSQNQNKEETENKQKKKRKKVCNKNPIISDCTYACSTDELESTLHSSRKHFFPLNLSLISIISFIFFIFLLSFLFIIINASIVPLYLQSFSTSPYVQCSGKGNQVKTSNIFDQARTYSENAKKTARNYVSDSDTDSDSDVEKRKKVSYSSA